MIARRAALVGLAAGGCARAAAKPPAGLLLRDFAPRPKLQVEAHEVPRARFPVVDFHQHTNDGQLAKQPVSVPALLAAMDRRNVRTLVILTGGWGERLRRNLEWARAHPDRFVVFAQVDWRRIDEPGFGARAADELRAALDRGARGLKVLKDLGLGAYDRAGRLIAVDDPRLDPIWAVCGELGVPVAIHTSDPAAFFDPVDRHDERWDELQAHPNWSFHGPGWPSKAALLEARDRVFARHPKTRFVALHVGNWPENLDAVSAMLRRFPHVDVEIGARQAGLGRQPARARRFFLEHQDRVLFGTDANLSEGNGYGATVYPSYFRFLETADEHFPYHGHPHQGRWMIYGLALPDEVLRKVYGSNADRVLARR